MIPSIINRQHLLQAIQQARREGIPRGRQSRDYCLTHDSGHYPPKYIIAMAHNIARGRLLKSDEFNGGRESNDFLRSREFTVVECTCGGIGPSTESVVQKVATSSSGTVARPLPTHSERCPECKVRIGQMLERIYGTCLRDHRFPWSAQLSDYRATPIFSTLNAVLDSLEAHRGHRNFVKARQLDPCDFFVPEPGFIVEIDESQHFTVPRRLALSHYPPDVEVGFSVDRWISLCDKHNAKDNNPPYRDEQRAWYDTLRDMAPLVEGLEPTVRLHSSDYQWCSLNPDSSDDRAWFDGLLTRRWPQWDVDVEFDLEPWIARIVINGAWSGAAEDAAELLELVCDTWDSVDEIRNVRTKFLMTCAGFLEFEWPTDITRNSIGDCWNPAARALRTLFSAGELAVRRLLTPPLLERIAQFTDYLTLGVDSAKDTVSTTGNYISALHAELVALVNTRTGHQIWTGKSYPTNGQQGGLVRVPDLETHFVKLPGMGRVMILGCHDLTMFNNRNLEKTGPVRRSLKNGFRQLAKTRGPVAVLHHPHTTPSSRTWASAWGVVRTELPSVKWYAGAGRYCAAEKKLAPLESTNVLSNTRQGSSIDFVARVNPP